MSSLQSALIALLAPLLSKASNFARSYLESGRFMSLYLARRLLGKDSPQRLLLSAQFGAQEGQDINYGSLWVQNGSGQFSIEKGFWKDIDKACASSLAGFVPYIKGETRLGVHHFWSVNYGLRKQLLGHVVLLKGGAFVASSKFILPAYHFAVIDLEDIFGLQDGDGVYVEVYHPKIPKGHGGHNGQLRYWGIYGEHLSTVHSLPIQKTMFRQAVARSCRGTFPASDIAADLVKSFYCWGGDQRVLPSSLNHFSEATPFGFYFIERSKKLLTSIWHSAAYTAAKARPGARIQAVAFPPVPKVDAAMSFVEAIGAAGKVNFLLYKNSELIDHVSRVVGPEDQFLAHQLFPDTDLSGVFLVVDFSDHGHCIHSGYLHLIYLVENEMCDSVHSHWLDASRFKGAGKDKEGDKSVGGQSLKFMHFPATSAYQSWLAVWTLNESVPVKLRFLAANCKEHLLNIDIPPVGVCYLNVSELFMQVAGYTCEHVVVQLESGFANLNANLYTFSPATKSLSVDHFTGG